MIGVNLIPAQQRQVRRHQSHLVWWGVAIGLVAVVGAISVTVGLAKATQVARLKLESRRDQASLEEQHREMLALTLQSSELRGQIERASALRAKRSWSALIAMIGRVAPREVWLTSLATDPTKPGAGALSGRLLGQRAARRENAPSRMVIEAPRRLVLAGYAQNQEALYELMGELKNTGVFVDVALRSSAQEKMMGGRKLDFDLYRFELTCEW